MTSLIFTLENIHPSDNFKGKKLSFQQNCDVHVAIDRVTYHSKKQQGKSTLFLSLMLLMQQRKRTLFAGIRIYCGLY